MFLKRIVGAVMLLELVLTAVGCKRAELTDDFADYDIPPLRITEEIEMKAEFPEYDSSARVIAVTIKNNSDSEYGYGERFVLQKLDGEEWRYIVVIGAFQLIACGLRPGEESPIYFNLAEHTNHPLLPGRYRIGFPTYYEGEYTPVAEFTIK